MKTTAFLLAAALCAGGCNCGANPCGGCGPARACDVTTKSCGPALAYGAPCQDDAGNPLPLPCQDGTSCQTAVFPAVCAEGCNPIATPTCASPQQCWQVVDDAGLPVAAADGTALGYCAGVAGEGQVCGPVGLSFCAPGLACVFFVQDSADGVCFAPCSPSAPGCAVPEQCLAVFSDPTLGICAIPQPPDAGCVQAEGLFCGQGQICLDPGDGGSCYPRCTPGASDPCPAPQSCLAPTTDATVGICAQAMGPGGACNPNAGQFCDSQSYCIIDVDGGSSCHLACSPQAPGCPGGQSCYPLTGTALYACG